MAVGLSGDGSASSPETDGTVACASLRSAGPPAVRTPMRSRQSMMNSAIRLSAVAVAPKIGR